MERILKDNTNKIWVNTSNQIIKERPFSETVIQNGLVFWGQANPDYLTIVDGLVSEAYDVRGTGTKMIQNTVSWRPTFGINCLQFRLNGQLYISGTSASTLFLVCQNAGGSSYYKGLGSSNGDMIGWINYNIIYKASGVNSYYYLNTLRTNSLQANSNKIILHSEQPIAMTTVNLGKTVINQSTEYLDVYEWGWYNRVLSVQEIIYNINALNIRNKVF